MGASAEFYPYGVKIDSARPAQDFDGYPKIGVGSDFFPYESKEFIGKRLTEGGLRVGYAWDYGNYGLALYGRNITNQMRATGGIDFNNLTGFINEPWLWGVEFKARF